MFTGIVEEIGRVRAFMRGAPAARLRVEAARVLEGTRVGDSVAVDGVCLTVVALHSDGFEVDVQEETLRRTTLGEYIPGRYVNLERAVTPTSRMGGHYVQGHIDDVGVVTAWRPQGNDWVLRVRVPVRLRRYIVEKGFLAVNGISLTVAGCQSDITFHIIPHTRAVTTLQYMRVGERVNLEVDVLAKYVEALVR
ncbi:MAG: riboflavin synthase [bacterium]|nr:riboflavin synthase [bacterium]